VNNQCVPTPMGHTEFCFGAPTHNSSRLLRLRLGGVFVLPAFCILLIVSGCGVAVGGSSPSAVTALQVNPNSVSFGDVQVGQTATASVSLVNPGTAAVSVAQLNVTGQTFSVAGGTLPATIAAGATYTFQIAFKPAADSTYSGQFTAMGPSSQTLASGSISGAGESSGSSSSTTPSLTVSALSLSFDAVNDGSSATLPITLTSTGTGAVTVDSDAIAGTGFSVSGHALPVTLNPQQSVTLNVTFAPTAPGTDTGALTIQSNSAEDPTAVISLAGIGRGAASPVLTVTTADLTFGTINDGS
jgi:hypothetical protein